MEILSQFHTTRIPNLEEIVIDHDAYDDALQPCDDGTGYRILSDDLQLECPESLEKLFHTSIVIW